MAGKGRKTRVDPELTRQLGVAAAADGLVQAVVYLRCDRPTDPDSVSAAAQRVIESATATAGTAPARVNVMRYIGTVAVEGPASFVRALIEETDVTSAVANVHPDDDPGLGKVSGSGDRMAGTREESATTAEQTEEPDAETAPGKEEAAKPEAKATTEEGPSASDNQDANDEAEGSDRAAADHVPRTKRRRRDS